jgi:hypothetical protein
LMHEIRAEGIDLTKPETALFLEKSH